MEESEGPTIEVRNLSKKFEIYDSPTSLLWEFVTRRTRHRDFWALRDLSFSVNAGEILGVIGRNGAGKTTLLRILAGTLERSSGDLRVQQPVAAILELGVGFHPEYTGRSNIFLGGLFLGIPKRVLEQQVDWIIDFSELGDAIDQPLKTYSTGMYARLAFSTAVCVDPEVLIIDEALSVGDVRFQRKCYAKMEEFKNSGKTILFVSHDMPLICENCDRCIYLDAGNLVMEGDAKNVTERYLGDLLGGEDRKLGESLAATTGKSQEMRYGSRDAEIEEVTVRDKMNHVVTRLDAGGEYTLACRVLCRSEMIDDLHVGFTIRTVEGISLFAINSRSQKVEIPSLKREEAIDVRVKFTNWLAPGDYFISVGAWSLRATSHYDRRVDVLHIHVQGDCGLLGTSRVNLSATYEVNRG